MSSWFHILGIVTVSPLGRTQHEKRYILESVLEHLPLVQGSEGGMNVHIIQRCGHDLYSSHDEYGLKTDHGISLWDSDIQNRRGFFRTQSQYMLVLESDLRDVEWDEGVRMLTKWLCRLASRVGMDDIMVKCYGGGYRKMFDNARPFDKMMVDPSWWDDPERWAPPGVEQNWCEHLMWKQSCPYWTEED